MKQICAGFPRGGIIAAFGSIVCGASLQAATHYVWTNSLTSSPPYTNWPTAAHTIQDALDAAGDGDSILVTNGFYLLPGELIVSNSVTLQSVNGPTVTLIDGNGPVTSNRCMLITASNVVVDGFTVTHGYAADWEYGGGVRATGSQVAIRNCRIEGNESTGGGGAVSLRGDGFEVDHCRISGNRAGWGGGILVQQYGGTIRNCDIVGNRVDDDNGGGIVLASWDGTCTVHNCFISGNTAWSGAGIRFDSGIAVVRHCTITGNIAREDGGGILLYEKPTNLMMENSIVYHNQALRAPEYQLGSWISEEFQAHHTCTAPLPAGTGNIDVPPGLHSPYQSSLTTNAICIDAGNNALSAGSMDIDDEPRTNAARVDIGCDEVWTDALTGMVTAVVQVIPENALLGYAQTFTSLTEGRVSGFRWDLGDGTVADDVCVLQHAYATTGTFEVVLTAWNNDGSTAATVTVDIVESYTNYVATDGGHVPPFSSWANAATTLQAAIDANYVGAVTLVATGVYDQGGMVLGPTHRVVMVKPLTVMAADPDPTRTIIVGEMSTNGPGTRCAYLTEGATLAGFTLTGGAALDDGNLVDQSGGGVLCFGGGTLSNCIVTGNSSRSYGGGVACYHGGTILDCDIRENQSTNGSGGGIYLGDGGWASGCTVVSNDASIHAGGIEIGDGSVISNCTVSQNRCGYWGGGIVGRGDCEIYNTTSSYNHAGYYAGGLQLDNGARARNCWIAYNTATNKNMGGGGAYVQSGSALLDSTILANDADNGGGVYLSGGDTVVSNCLIQSNHSTPYGRGLYRRSGYGGGVYLRSGALLVDSVVFANDAFWAGGVHVDRSGTIDRCDILSNDALQDYYLGVGGYAGGIYLYQGGLVTNCFIARQFTRNSGGGVYMDDGEVVNSTIISNSAHVGGGLLVAGGRVADCLIQDNIMRDNFSGGGVKISSTNALMENCDIIGNTALLYGEGGGVAISAGAVVRSCLIMSNQAWQGGGVYTLRDGLEDCDIVDNVAERGGGIYSAYGNFGGNYVRNCRVIGNASTNRGGGIFFEGGTIEDVTFSHNWSMADGGGLFCETGIVWNCDFLGNDSGSDGGGVYADGYGRIIDCTFVGNTASNRGGGVRLDAGGEVVNGLFHGNQAASGGGAFLGGGALLGRLQNCTLAGNHATVDGGGIHADDSGIIENTIAFHNTCPTGSSNVYTLGSGHQFEFSCVAPAVTGAGNISSDPQFVGGSDYRPAQTSPCVDAGTSLAGVPHDLDGISRPLDGNADGTNTCDMGCYEFIHATADTDGDTMPDLWEAGHHLDPTNAVDAADDSDGDGAPNRDEHVADTDPWDSGSVFCITGMEPGNHFTVTFACTNSRMYSLEGCAALTTGPWSGVSNLTSLWGEADGEMSLTDPNPDPRPAYRATVRLP